MIWLMFMGVTFLVTLSDLVGVPLDLVKLTVSRSNFELLSRRAAPSDEDLMVVGKKNNMGTHIFERMK